MPHLTITDLAEELRCSPSKLARMTRAKQIPHLRLGRLIRYELEAVKAALRVEAAQHRSPAGTSRGRLGLVRSSPITLERLQAMRQEIREANRQRRDA